MKIKLFHLAIVVIITIITTSLVYSQNNITNTLGSGGTFTIKDASNSYLTLSQSTGEVNILRGLRIPETGNSSTTGVIFKGGSSFIHDFRPTGTPGYNTFVGSGAGNFTMTHTGGNDATYNTGIGSGALLSLTTGHSNTALGYSALVSNTSGYDNTALGTNSLISNTGGRRNTAIGALSLYYNTDGGDNTALGYGALYNNTTGYENTAVGYASLSDNLTGIYNTAMGYYSLLNNTTGAYNTACGYQALRRNISGTSNTAIGFGSLSDNTIGIQNTTVGFNSLRYNIGNYNTALGYSAGSIITTGANLTCIGIGANPTTATAIDQITLGNQFIQSLRCNVQSISSLSDARDKKSIEDLDLGIDFLMKIKPRLFYWDKREWYDDNESDGSKMKEKPTAGFIAQELDEVQTTENAEWLNLVLKDNPEKLEATPGNLLPIIVNAIQDLKKENNELRMANTELKSKLNNFEQMQNMLVGEMDKLKTNSTEITKVSLGEK